MSRLGILGAALPFLIHPAPIPEPRGWGENHSKGTKTPKQLKKRAKAKRARKARKRQRKRRSR